MVTHWHLTAIAVGIISPMAISEPRSFLSLAQKRTTTELLSDAAAPLTSACSVALVNDASYELWSLLWSIIFW